MTVPSNIVYTQGTGAPPITADNLNTFIQVVSTLASARGFTGVSGMQIFLQGYNAPGDGGQGNFYWNTTTGTDDGGVTTIVPTGSTSGCWSRQPKSAPSYLSSTITYGSAVSLTTATAANLTSLTLTPGTWLVGGNVGFKSAGSTSITALSGWASASSASQPSAELYNGIVTAATVPGATGQGFSIPQQSIVVAVSTTTVVYLSVQATFTVSTFGGYGSLWANLL